jgi:hypothetical protein
VFDGFSISVLGIGNNQQIIGLIKQIIGIVVQSIEMRKKAFSYLGFFGILWLRNLQINDKGVFL